MNQDEEHAKTYYEALKLALNSNDKTAIKRAKEMREYINFSNVPQPVLDKLDELYQHKNYTE